MIKSVVEDKEVSEYPKMMISDNGLVVLFKDNEQGTVINTGNSSAVLASCSVLFDMKKFKPFHGSVTLTQE